MSEARLATTARLEKPEHWHRNADGEPTTARLLCGKRDADGVQRCRGVFGFVDLRALQIVLEGMAPDASGVYRSTAKAWPVVVTQRGEDHLRRHLKQRHQLQGAIINLIPPPVVIPRAECPRCHKEQDLLDAEDVDSLKNAMLQ